MQHMFRTRKVEVYMGLIWLLWQKKWKCNLFVKKSKENFFLLAKGVFDVKWCGESKKVGPNALRCFLIEKLGVFWKNGWLRFVAKIIFFRKIPISQKVSVVEHRDQIFLLPPLILHQKHPLLTKEKNVLVFLSQKWHFHHFGHNDHGTSMKILTLHILNGYCISWVGFLYFQDTMKKWKMRVIA